MKKLVIGIVTVALITAGASHAFAKEEPLQNQNMQQTQTQNQGSSQQIRTETQEQTEMGESQQSSDAENGEGMKNGQGKMEQTQEQTQQREMMFEGVGQKLNGLKTMLMEQTQEQTQLQELLQNQEKTQTQLKNQFDKLASRSGLVRFIIGPDFKTIQATKQELQQVQVRIKQLTELKNKLTNEADQTQIQEAIQVLTEQQTYLQNELQNREGGFSLFGWLFRFLQP